LRLTIHGVVYRHGPGCAGSGHLPIEGSIKSSPTCDTILSQNSDQSSFIIADVDSTNNNIDMTSYLLDKLKAVKGRLLKHIPKASRSLSAEKFSMLLDNVIKQPNDVYAWINLLLFAYSCFGVSHERGGKRHMSSLTSKVNKLLTDYPHNEQHHVKPNSKIRYNAKQSCTENKLADYYSCI
jgi:hypothetical protein